MIEAIEEHRGESPVVLLDDVDSELDATRRALFFGMLEENHCQVLITATDAYSHPKDVNSESVKKQSSDTQPSGPQVFRVVEGKILER